MKGEIRRRARARQDLIEIFQRHAREAGLRVARRFRSEAEAALTRLAGRPGMGARYEAEDPAFAGLRSFPLGSPFKNYVVFYRPTPDGIEVIRVLHGARDIASILLEDLDLDDGEDDDTTGEGPE